MKNARKVSFANDIRPLSRSVGIEHMTRANILLDDCNYMSEVAPNGPHWTQDKLDRFENWMKNGCQP